MRRTSEAFWWSLFSAGGVMAALFIPVLIVVTGFVVPFAGGDGTARYEALQPVLSFWLVRLVLFGVVFLALFHCAHRIRHILMDLGLRGAPALLTACCYGAALTGTVAAAIVLVAL